jgi:hypothetical protein
MSRKLCFDEYARRYQWIAHSEQWLRNARYEPVVQGEWSVVT